MHNLVYFRMTENCNLQCRHCCYNCGPGGISMDWENIERVLKNMSGETTGLIISGGECFTRKETLHQLLDYIQLNREKRFPKLGVQVQTNGFWAHNAEAAYRTIKWLSSHGVTSVEVTGVDNFHKEQGLNINAIGNNLDSANRRLAAERTYVDISGRGATGGVLPVGRASKLPQSLWVHGLNCNLPSNYKKGNYIVTVSADGLAHLCCWQLLTPLGSALDSPIDELVSHARNDRFFGAFINGGVTQAAKDMGFYKEQELDLYKNQCLQCIRLFGPKTI